MQQLVRRFAESFRKCDRILLLLCVIATVFGGLMIASSTGAYDAGSTRYLLVHFGASAMGIFFFLTISSIDTNWFSERRTMLVIFNTVLLLMLLPFGVKVSGNRSWLSFPFLPFNIQPAEICKISFILIMASVMASYQNNISSLRSVGHMGIHLLLLFGTNVVISGDMGVSLIFAFIFVGMTYAGGLSWKWYGVAAAAGTVFVPAFWFLIMEDYQKKRIMVLFDPSLDQYGTGAMYHTIRAMRSLTGGGLSGQGLFEGNRTQSGALFAQHTDYIFASIGEELGFLGCAAVLILLGLVVARCIWVGIHSQDYLRRMVCFGAASALIFQIMVNVGMCIGVMPVIGLTLPFISYGGSSIITLYAMLGLVSGVYARPSPTSHERYIHAPIRSKGGYL